jgi:hypothetical protein
MSEELKNLNKRIAIYEVFVSLRWSEDICDFII